MMSLALSLALIAHGWSLGRLLRPSFVDHDWHVKMYDMFLIYSLTRHFKQERIYQLLQESLWVRSAITAAVRRIQPVQ